MEKDFTAWMEPKHRLVRCESKMSKGCLHWHMNDKPMCEACRDFIRGKFSPADQQSSKNAVKTLTPRQVEVLRHYTSGVPIKEIGDLLGGLSAKTVEYHLSKCRERLNIYNFIHLVHYALEKGFIDNHYSPKTVDLKTASPANESGVRVIPTPLQTVDLSGDLAVA